MQTMSGLKHLAVAQKRARQLHKALNGLLEDIPDTHESYLELMRDAEELERRLQFAVAAVGEVFRQDPCPSSRTSPDGLLECQLTQA